MCLISIAWRAHPRYELVLAANRDEFHNRPTAPAAFWTDAPQVFGGRDLSQGGGWLALSTRRRLAAVTNVRRMVPSDPRAPSRGGLISGFVTGSDSAAAFAQQLRVSAESYAGYNLLLWDGNELLYVSNAPQFTLQKLTPGVHAVSNAALDTPWPKLRRLKTGFGVWTGDAQEDPAPLLQLLADDREAEDTDLPDTGVGLEMERFLSPPFIRGLHYGTRCSTVIAVAGDAAQFTERRFGANGLVTGETVQTLTLDPKQGAASA